MSTSGWPPPRLADERGPDVVCLQELKAADADFPRAIEKAGYGAVARPEVMERRRHPGARLEPIVTRDALPGDPR